MKSIKILDEDINQVQLAFYKYNALKDLVASLAEKNLDCPKIFIDLMTEQNIELEKLKTAIVSKYIKDPVNITYYMFNFYENELKYEVG